MSAFSCLRLSAIFCIIWDSLRVNHKSGLHCCEQCQQPTSLGHRKQYFLRAPSPLVVGGKSLLSVRDSQPLATNDRVAGVKVHFWIGLVAPKT